MKNTPLKDMGDARFRVLRLLISYPSVGWTEHQINTQLKPIGRSTTYDALAFLCKAGWSIKIKEHYYYNPELYAIAIRNRDGILQNKTKFAEFKRSYKQDER